MNSKNLQLKSLLFDNDSIILETVEGSKLAIVGFEVDNSYSFICKKVMEDGKLDDEDSYFPTTKEMLSMYLSMLEERI